VEENLYRFLLFVFIYMCCHWRSSYRRGEMIYLKNCSFGVIKKQPFTQDRRVVIPLTGLTSSHFCACPKPGPRFPSSYVVVFFLFNGLRWVVIIDVDWIVDHHCMHFLRPKKIYVCLLSHGKTGNSRSWIRFRYFIYEISGKPSFVLKLFMTSYAVFLPSLLSISTKS
jgi:hypothetical protein